MKKLSLGLLAACFVAARVAWGQYTQPIVSNGGGGNTISVTNNPGSSTGAVQFNTSNNFAGDATHFFWDATNHFLGINTNAPASPLEVRGTGTTYSLVVSTTSATQTLNFAVKNNGAILLNKITYVWPSAQGGASTCLQNDGSGNLSWASCGGGGTSPTVLTLAAAASGSVSLPAAANGVWRVDVHFTQNTSAAAIEIQFNSDTTVGHYSWGQMSSNDSGGSFNAFGVSSDLLIPLNFDDGVVTVKSGTDFFSNFTLSATGTTSAINGETHQVRSSDSSNWFGTIHGAYNAVPTTLQIQATGGTMTGSVVITAL